MSFADLRDELLAASYDDIDETEEGTPLENTKLLEWTKKVNTAEAAFWASAAGDRVADSTDVLGFECGGSQWVLETVRFIRTFRL